MGPEVRLAGERVVLRTARSQDADVLAEGFKDDPTLGAMLGMEPHEENADWLRSTFPADGDEADQPSSHWFAIADPETDVAIGEIGLVGISSQHRRAGLSIFMLPASRRAGAGREAIELLVEWGQRECGLHRIEIRTLPENAPMRALAEASGFAYEGVLRDYTFERGRYNDNLVYSRLPD